MFFQERVIFKGSEKTPSENEFKQFLSKHDGRYVTGTVLEETSFSFQIQESYFNAGLERFSQFFRTPLVPKDAVIRERNSIKSNFESYKNNSDARLDEILSSMVQPEIPYRFFPWLLNLKPVQDNIDDDELYVQVHEFQRRHYSAHRMNLCLQARLSLDELQELAVKHFSIIPNNQLPPVEFSAYSHENLCVEKFYNKTYFIKTALYGPELNIFWCLPPVIKVFNLIDLKL